jgi:single-strand DNA-binding protein
MNQMILAGHLGADPEVRFTSSGQKVTTLRVATRVRRSSKDETIWWRVTIWGEQFDKMIPYFKKGSAIIVVGELNKPEIFTDREERPQVSMSVTAHNIMFSPFGRTDGQGATEGSESGMQSYKPHQEMASIASMAPAASMGPIAHEVSQGQGQVDPTFTEDEIPF